MRSVTFKCYDTIAIDRWCEITVTVKELPAMGGMEKRYDVTYVARYPGKAADYATLHPLAPRPTADTDTTGHDTTGCSPDPSHPSSGRVSGGSFS